MFDTSPPYRGRFAPSPTGPLHLGSLIAALASYLDARITSGSWLLRMEDLDPPREEAGRPNQSCTACKAMACTGTRISVGRAPAHEAYAEACSSWRKAATCFTVTAAASNWGQWCLPRRLPGSPGGYWQPLCGPGERAPGLAHPTIVDGIQGEQRIALGEQLPDFVVRRKDGLDAYQLAVVVDDAAQGITHIVRGSDLLDSTPRQIYLQQLLGYPTPSYCHLPVITNAAGRN